MFILNDTENSLINDIASVAFETLGLSGDAYVEVNFISADEIRRINAQTRNVDKKTDVLSFPMLCEIKPFTKENYMYDYDDNMLAVGLGSILICVEVAREQADEYGHGYERELSYLFLHGLLHILGYDHEDEFEKKEMRSAEEKILEKMGIRR